MKQEFKIISDLINKNSHVLDVGCGDGILMEFLIKEKKVGYIDCEDIVIGISKMKLSKQNTYNEVFAEVEKLAFKINKVI